MKSYSVICFFLLLAMILCPLCSVEKAKQVISEEFRNEGTAFSSEETTKKSPVSTVKIMSANSKNITETTLDEYLLGVVASEMNAMYSEEAIKAQIIASHTLLEYTKQHKPENLGDADITDSSATHQGYLAVDGQKEKWGDNYDEYSQKVMKCIEEVKDIIIYYDNRPIFAAFHAINNGRTERASDVWGGEYPYLISVPSDGDKLSPVYLSQVSFSKEDFEIKLDGQTEIPDSLNDVIGEISRTETGMVKEITVGGKVFKGTEIRKIFSLRSSTFDCECDDNEIIFTVRGYGHGVGMSQYGAEYMAQQGADYKDILTHYYSGVEIA